MKDWNIIFREIALLFCCIIVLQSCDASTNNMSAKETTSINAPIEISNSQDTTQTMNNETYKPKGSVEEQIAQCLNGFIKEMNKWEIDAYNEGLEYEKANKKLLPNRDKMLKSVKLREDAYLTIFRKYVVPDYTNHGSSYGNPPEYDPATETIQSIIVESFTEAIVTTEKEQFGEDKKQKYSLIKLNGNWLIKDKKIWIKRTLEWLDVKL